MRRIVAILAVPLLSMALPRRALAGPVADENAKAGSPGQWMARGDGTARFAGVVDVYPAKWSIAPGEPIRLKVRSTRAYDVRVFRLGWYSGTGQRQVALIGGRPASPQPYPVADPVYGLAEAKWADSVAIATDASWTTGLYVARVEQASGGEATTFFTLRDDGAKQRQPILLVVGLDTHAAYNCWPGPARGGKSLYGFNSSAVEPSESISGINQAVKVSLDRPFFVGGGTADVSQYEYPLLRYLERTGREVAYATDEDLHRDPGIASGRRVVTFAGHEEYTSWEMFDNALAARDAGANFLFLTGDTWSWQIRHEAGAAGATSTIVGYKESWIHDPLQKKAYSLKTQGKIAEARTKYRLVTRGWRNLEYDPVAGIDERRPGMILTGVQSAGIIRDARGNPTDASSYPWADLVVTDPSFWIYAGTGVVGGSAVPGVFGYEVDSTLASSSELDPWRKPGQRVFGTLRQVSDGAIKGSSSWYRAASGAEIVAMGAIFTSWGLDDYAAKASGHPDPTSPTLQRMIDNALTRWLATSTPPAPPPPDGGLYDAGPMADADPVEKDGGTYAEAGPQPPDAGSADTTAPDTTAPDTTAPDTMTAPDTAAELDSTPITDSAVEPDATLPDDTLATADSWSEPDSASASDAGPWPDTAEPTDVAALADTNAPRSDAAASPEADPQTDGSVGCSVPHGALPGERAPLTAVACLALLLARRCAVRRAGSRRRRR
jgi:hypothetical protein